MEEEKKTPEREEEQALPVQELPTDIPAEVRQKLAEDLNEQATEDLKQDVREAEKEEANDEEVKANPEMLTKSRLLKLLVKKQYVKLREVTEEEQPADLAELLEELDENNRLVVFRLLKKDVATEAFAYMSDEARDDLVNAFSDVELVSAIEDMSLDDAADLLEDMPAGVVKRVLEKSSRQTRESLNKLLNYPESSAGSLMTPEYVRLRQEMTVSDAFAALRRGFYRPERRFERRRAEGHLRHQGQRHRGAGRPVAGQVEAQGPEGLRLPGGQGPLLRHERHPPRRGYGQPPLHLCGPVGLGEGHP